MSNPCDETDDAAWVQRVQAGEIDAFGVLVSRYQTPIYNLLLRWLRDRDEAAEIAQDVFVAAFRALGRFRGEARFSTWLYQIAINQAKNRRKALARAATRLVHNSDDSEDDPLDRIPDPRPDPSDEIERRQLQSVVQGAINRLDPDDALVVILRDLQQHSYEEIARMLAVPEGTVKSRLHRARQALKARLVPWISSQRIRL